LLPIQSAGPHATPDEIAEPVETLEAVAIKAEPKAKKAR
jgi:hypothetical protein